MNIIRAEIQNNKLSHAYLIVGYGNDLVDIIVRESGCHPADVMTVEPISAAGKKGDIKVEQIGQLQNFLSLTAHGKLKVGVIKECQRLNQSSANILLKTLEEPPKNVILILISNSSAVLETIKSRCRIIKTFQASKELNHTFSYDFFACEPLAFVFREIEKISKENLIDEFLSFLTVELRARLLKKFSLGLAETISEVEKSKIIIGKNANSRLVLENLILKIRDTNND